MHDPYPGVHRQNYDDYESENNDDDNNIQNTVH